ncbi:MAG: DNA starvation/stationary phase protection protein [Rhizobiales bacterium]|nr:DNA starvation/stationary phase protection protein [Hyphomicrobiales bacterium]
MPAKSSNVRKLSKPNPATRAAPAALATPSDLDEDKIAKVGEAVNRLLADTFVLHLKTKNCHWHVRGPHFRDYHLLLDEQAADIALAIDPLAERVRKLGRETVHSYAEVLALATLKESESRDLTAQEMVAELIADNRTVIAALRETHDLCDDAGDIATASLLEEYVDAAEKRLWFLFETSKGREQQAS